MTTVPLPGPIGEPSPASDFYRLRREGIGHLERTGSAQWTDYNTHDPGITLLEALAYAITELSYRTGFDLRDILASSAAGASAADPYPGQAFFSARTILTVNPTTPEDVRRLLIDADQVRNAWVRCRLCACDVPLYAWCEDGAPVLSHNPSQRKVHDARMVPVQPRGLYDVVLELEADPEYGDLNGRRMVRRRTILDSQKRRHLVTIEARFPAGELARRDERGRLAEDLRPFTLNLTGPNRTTTGTTPVDDADLRRHFFDVLYVDFRITLADGTVITIANAAVRVFGDDTVRRTLTVATLIAWLGDTSQEGFVDPYRRQLAVTDQAVAEAHNLLDAHRNLDQDVCRVDLVEIDDIAACADVAVAADADLDLIQAQIWYEIERYLDPPIAFRSRDELLARGEPVEAMFNGPELTNGFLTAESLAEADLRTDLRVSDIIDRLIDIDGVISVENLQLTAYGADGIPMVGDTRQSDPDRAAASWQLVLRPGHRPSLHRGMSRFLFTSNGLPYLPRLDEAEDILLQLHGREARPKLRSADLDLPAPLGTARGLESYFPIQHSLPATYGICPAGLPSTATPLRRAQASQLKAYLMVYEQLLRNAYAQFAHVGDLFSLDPSVSHTYASTLLTKETIGDDGIVSDRLTPEVLARLVESPIEFADRRNRFLDHLLARFGESLGDYPMLLTDLHGQTRARTDLVSDNLAFLRALPRLGHDRGKAFHRSLAPCHPDNTSGLHQRINLLLGLPERTFTYRASRADGELGFEHTLSLIEHGSAIMGFPIAAGAAIETAMTDLRTEQKLSTVTDWQLEGIGGELTLTLKDDGPPVSRTLSGRRGASVVLSRALAAALRALLGELILPQRYRLVPAGTRWHVELVDRHGKRLGLSGKPFDTDQATGSFIAQSVTWAAHTRAIVVEHLLLRPKFPGDAIHPLCSEGPCDLCGCGDEDPYSFRLTYVMPGWTEPFNTNLSMRGFADRTIQEQTPSHLLVKTCWVGNDGYVHDPCDPIVDALAGVLEESALSREAACACAAEVYAAYGAVFESWFADHPLIADPPGVLRATLDEKFKDVDLSHVTCATTIDEAVRAGLQPLLVDHFVEIARHGYQFERFEDAWCRWAEADAEMDWTQERLQDTVVEVLQAGATGVPSHQALCTCAATILAEFGTSFRTWMDAAIAAGTPPDVDAFAAPPITLCDDITLSAGVDATIRDLLVERYRRYTDVSFRLHLLLRSLVGLHSTYPRATLHDCDEGSDLNPVRLGQTVLGTN